MSYKVFIRNWWKRNPDYPGGREPHAGRKHTLHKRIATEAEAREICKVYNANHEPGFLSRKAEYEEN